MPVDFLSDRIVFRNFNDSFLQKKCNIFDRYILGVMQFCSNIINRHKNTSFIREKIVSYLGYLGIKLDKKTNDVRGVEEIISTPDSKVTVCVIPTNEELAICRETVALVK